MTNTAALTTHEQAIFACWQRANHLPPLGYICRDRTVGFEPDPVVFPIVREIWSMAIAAASTSVIKARLDDMGFRTPIRGKLGGRPLTRRGVWRILRDPIYTGRIRWKSEWHTAGHKPVVTDEEFIKVQWMLAERRTRG